MSKKVARFERAIVINRDAHGHRAARGMLYGFAISAAFWLAIAAAIWLV